MSAQQPSLVIRGRPIFSFILSVGLLLLWLGQFLHAYVLVELLGVPDHELLAWMTLPFAAFFIVSGVFHWTRTITLTPEAVSVSHWFQRRHLALSDVSAVSLRARALGRSEMHSLEIWTQTNTVSPAMSIDLAHISRADLQRVLAHMQQHSPAVLDRELLRHARMLN